jgi:hypothetical protein
LRAQVLLMQTGAPEKVFENIESHLALRRTYEFFWFFG